MFLNSSYLWVSYIPNLASQQRVNSIKPVVKVLVINCLQEETTGLGHHRKSILRLSITDKTQFSALTTFKQIVLKTAQTLGHFIMMRTWQTLKQNSKCHHKDAKSCYNLSRTDQTSRSPSVGLAGPLSTQCELWPSWWLHEPQGPSRCYKHTHMDDVQPVKNKHGTQWSKEYTDRQIRGTVSYYSCTMSSFSHLYI